MEKNNFLNKIYRKVVKKETMKQLTLVIIIHSKFDAIIFFINQIKQMRNIDLKKIDIIFLFDNKNVPKDFLQELNDNGLNYYVNNKNIGKLNTILKNIDNYRTRYIKIIDQDDSIYIDGISKTVRKLTKLDGRNLVKHKALQLRKTNVKSEELFKQSLKKSVIKQQEKLSIDINFSQQTNCDTIYPVETLKILSKVNFTKQWFHNDILLSNGCVGLTNKLDKIDSKLYIQFYENGQTSKFNIQRSKGTHELYLNYINIFSKYNYFSLQKITRNTYNHHERFIKRFTYDYLKDYDKDMGEKLQIETMEILNNLWKN